MANVLRLFFDLSVNDGWNLVAICNYAFILLVVVQAIRERKANG